MNFLKRLPRPLTLVLATGITLLMVAMLLSIATPKNASGQPLVPLSVLQEPGPEDYEVAVALKTWVGWLQLENGKVCSPVLTTTETFMVSKGHELRMKFDDEVTKPMRCAESCHIERRDGGLENPPIHVIQGLWDQVETHDHEHGLKIWFSITKVAFYSQPPTKARKGAIGLIAGRSSEW